MGIHVSAVHIYLTCRREKRVEIRKERRGGRREEKRRRKKERGGGRKRIKQK